MSSVKRPRGGRAAKPGRKPAPKRRNNKQADHQDDDPSGSDVDGGGPARPDSNLNLDPTVRAALTSAFRPPKKIAPSGSEKAPPSALSLLSSSSSGLPAAAATSRRVAMPHHTGEEDAAGNGDDRGHGDDDDDDDDNDMDERADQPAAIGADEPDDPNDPDEPDEPASIPPQLLTRILHGFFRRDGTRITRAANDAVARYADVFVREAIVRAAGAAGGPFLEVEDLEKVAPQLLLDL